MMANLPRHNGDASPTEPRDDDMKQGTIIAASVANLLCAMALLLTVGASAADINDYPTSARGDYVFACMKVNGETQQSLERCSCSIDVIASLIPYERYVDAQTILSMAQVPGNLGTMFRATEFSKKTVDDLRRAQAEAEVRCF
jgi:hypothetical protein